MYIGEEREVDLVGALLRRPLHRAELVFVDAMRVVQEATDQRGLAVVHRADGDEPQELLVLVAAQVLFDVAGDQRVVAHRAQKYPSRFLVSIEPSSSKSIRRPCRSDCLVSSISRMISGSVVADERMAPESG